MPGRYRSQCRWRAHTRSSGARYRRAGTRRPVRATVHTGHAGPQAATASSPRISRPTGPAPYLPHGSSRIHAGRARSSTCGATRQSAETRARAWGVEVDLAVRVQHAGEVLQAAEVGDGGEQVADGEVVAGGEPGQERQRQLSWQRGHQSCRAAGDGGYDSAGGCRLESRTSALGHAVGRGRAALVCHAGCPYFRRAGRAWVSAAASSSTSFSSCLVMRSVPSVMAIRAASRMRWERLPIRPPVLACR